MKKKNQKKASQILSIILVIAMLATIIMSIVPMYSFNREQVVETNLEELIQTNSTEAKDDIVTEETEVVKEEIVEETENIETEELSLEELKEEKRIANIKLTTGENIKIALYPKIAPLTVENFINLVETKFYDGVIFHRVIEDFMVQTGDPEGTGMGGSDKNVKGEFDSNGVKNPLSHTKGIVSMARANDPNSGSSQFFITVADSTYLDGQYAAFGEVLEGQEVADRISQVETDEMDKPLEEIKIETITLE